MLLRFKIIFKENELKFSVNSKNVHKNSVSTLCNNSVKRCGRLDTIYFLLQVEFFIFNLF